MEAVVRDRFGIAYRPALAASLWANAHEIDLIEVIADDWFGVSGDSLRALSTLSRRIPVELHGVGLGLASASSLDPARACALARVLEACGTERWSEHLAFVRAGGVELGQLCAPPRTEATLEGLARNLEQVRRIVGSLPALENVATLLDPPCSELTEASFVRQALDRTGAPLLLDLHNLYANALNFEAEPLEQLAALPLERVRSVHLAGGRWLRWGEERRLLDDHRSAVPNEVYALLEELAARVDQPLDILVEHDGTPPHWEAYTAELSRARQCVARGRARRRVAREAGCEAELLTCGDDSACSAREAMQRVESRSNGEERAAGAMCAREAAALEGWLARIYTDPLLRARFLAAPKEVLAAAPVSARDRERLLLIDRVGLELHARSLTHQRGVPRTARPRLRDHTRAWHLATMRHWRGVSAEHSANAFAKRQR